MFHGDTSGEPGPPLRRLAPALRRITPSAQLPLLLLELLLEDLSTRVPLAENLKGRIRPRLLALTDQPADAEHDADDHHAPEGQHDHHHPDPPGAPHPRHRVHAPPPLTTSILSPPDHRHSRHTQHTRDPWSAPSH